ncbi:hypothetical protein BDF22DRAFT_376063 [Syncephalis plumigaleata]|nr:hypothetical protein BDF22DRAFT_376063 [Syncephalis plumigaleata]
MMVSITPPLPDLTTTEAVVRTLKSTHYTYDERLAVAVWLWSNDTLAFPQRQEFVLDWCVHSMLRFATKKGASVLGTPASQLNFWQFLLTAFDGTSSLTAVHRTAPADTTTQRNNKIIASINAPLLPLFVGALRAIKEQIEQSSAAEEDIQSLNKVLEIATTCLRRLVSSLGEQLQLTSEHLVDAIILALTVWKQTMNQSDFTDKTVRLHSLHSMALTLLNEFSKLCKRQTNQKKVFTLMTDKLLTTLLEARYLSATSSTSDTNQSALVTSIELLLRRSLFHVDNLADFSTVLGSRNTQKSSRNNDSRDIASYQKSLFTQLETMIKETTTSQQVHAILATLLRLFIDESRKRQKTMTAQHQNADSNEMLVKQLEFSFFVELYRINSMTVSSLVESLRTGNALLRTLADMQVYQSSNESVYEQQRAFFNNIAINSANDLDNTTILIDQWVLFERFTVLLSLDYSIIEPVIQRVITKTIVPSTYDNDMASTFIIELLQLQVKSRQFDVYIEQLLAVLNSWSPKDESILTTTPLLSTQFTSVLEQQVRKVPMAQITRVLAAIRQLLIEQSQQQSSTSSSNEGKKRQKLDKKTARAQVKTASITSQLLLLLLGHIIRALPASAALNGTTDTYGIQQEIQELGRLYVIPTLEQCQRQGVNDSTITYAVISLHAELMASCRVYWQQYASINMLKSLPTSNNARLALTWTNAILVWMNGWIMENPQVVASNDTLELDGLLQQLIIQAIPNNNNNNDDIHLQLDSIVSWDERLVTLDDRTGAAAQWLLIFSDWFLLISTYVNDKQLDQLLTFLLELVHVASSNEHSHQLVRFSSLFDRLLNKPWFFESIRLQSNYYNKLKYISTYD